MGSLFLQRKISLSEGRGVRGSAPNHQRSRMWSKGRWRQNQERARVKLESKTNRDRLQNSHKEEAVFPSLLLTFACAMLAVKARGTRVRRQSRQESMCAVLTPGWTTLYSGWQRSSVLTPLVNEAGGPIAVSSLQSSKARGVSCEVSRVQLWGNFSEMKGDTGRRMITLELRQLHYLFKVGKEFPVCGVTKLFVNF